MNKRTERAITIALSIGLIAYFCYQVAYGEKETCPGFMDKGKCLTIGKQPYQFAYHDGKQAGLIAFFQVGDSCDSRHIQTKASRDTQMHITEQRKQHEQ